MLPIILFVVSYLCLSPADFVQGFVSVSRRTAAIDFTCPVPVWAGGRCWGEPHPIVLFYVIPFTGLRRAPSSCATGSPVSLHDLCRFQARVVRRVVPPRIVCLSSFRIFPDYGQAVCMGFHIGAAVEYRGQPSGVLPSFRQAAGKFLSITSGRAVHTRFKGNPLECRGYRWLRCCGIVFYHYLCKIEKYIICCRGAAFLIDRGYHKR